VKFVSGGVFEFFNFKIFLGLPLFVPFLGFAVFSSSR
jgi:hypothetical protein